MRCAPNDLYVALTRTTHRLCIVHPGNLPEFLASKVGHHLAHRGISDTAT